MEIQTCIDEFDGNIVKAHQEIGKNIIAINKADERIQDILEAFRKEFEKIDINGENRFEKELKEKIGIYQKECSQWCSAMGEFVKGKEFINQFEKSVLVVVFGNVNVGKSSVGNLIAGTADEKRNGDDQEILKRYFGSPPEFYEYDMTGAEGIQDVKKKEGNFFKEGHIETTNNIQYFTRKGGLTWTDSPGIHSVNKENGDLAKKYVEFADLVVFITTSSSPAKNDEVKELRKLFSKQKPVLIVINKSDRIDKDEIDGQIVKMLLPKTDNDRKKQENYVSGLFKEESQEMFLGIEAVSISTYLALDGLRKGDFAVFESSGLPKFYQHLGKVLDEKAVRLKMNAPKARINAAIDEVINGGRIGGNLIYGIEQFKDQMNQTVAHIEACKKKLETAVLNAKPELIHQIEDRVYPIVQDGAAKVREGAESVDTREEINRMVMEETRRILEPKIQGVLDDFDSKMVALADYHGVVSSEVKASFQEIKRTEYEVKVVQRNPEGLIENLSHLLFGTEYKRNKMIKHTIVERYQNGDNSVNILKEIQTEVEKTITQYMNDYIDAITREYFNEIIEVIKAMREAFRDLRGKLEKERITC